MTTRVFSDDNNKYSLWRNDDEGHKHSICIECGKFEFLCEGRCNTLKEYIKA
jgi:Fe2+ or Zn2+ uptake regulation protein